MSTADGVTPTPSPATIAAGPAMSKTILCPACSEEHHDEASVASCWRCADRAAVRAFLAHVKEGPLRARADAVVEMLYDALLSDALTAADGNQHEAARALGCAPPTIHVFVRKHPHLRRAFPAKPSAHLRTYPRDAEGRIRARGAAETTTPEAQVVPAAPAVKKPPRTKR